MKPESNNQSGDSQLDRLIAAAREDAAAGDAIEFGLETRVLARLREERRGSWLAWAWRFCPYAAGLAAAAAAWSYTNLGESLEGESVYAAVRLAGKPVLDYYLGSDE
jgi:hypothetical protein